MYRDKAAGCRCVLAESLAIQRGTLWTMGLCVCACAAVVPAGLLEFRYFTVPAVIAALNLPPAPLQALRIQCAACLAVNAATLYMLAERPFLWPDGSVARFMW